ncbi:MAG: asparagine synthetase B, partial [Proteobacteria bacterium]|nr:asparagine synthetase B [Pseudomonadota bacterium]
MCGVFGFIGRAALDDMGRCMADTMIHRGPNSRGVWSNQTSDNQCVIFAHRRLSILDLSDAGSQPMTDTSGRFVLTFNGEIYNYREIGADLRRTGVQFRSSSDTEVLLEAYKA